jgi:Na+-transporting NADH:ubiquinone oxidoreductase subunit A
MRGALIEYPPKGNQVKFKGGYNIALEGRPSSEIKTLPEPDALYLPIRTARFTFSEICVEDGRRVNAGEILAKDHENYSVPLFAPRAGLVRLKSAENHIVLEDIAKAPQSRYTASGQVIEDTAPHIAKQMGSGGITRYKLLTLGAWQFFYDAHNSSLPDPFKIPQAIIVSTVNCEPFLARGDVQLRRDLQAFNRGLEHLQSLLEYQQIYLAVPDIESDFARRLQEKIRGYAWIKIVEIPLVYPNDNFTILARNLGLKPDNGPVWALRTEGVLAVDRALTSSQPCTERIVSVGGPAAEMPEHIEAVYGYPLSQIAHSYACVDDVRIINGGVFTGRKVEPEQLGLDSECAGLTILPEATQREFLAFAQPGLRKRSYSKWCFLGGLRSEFKENLTTAIQGEERACISCNFCEEVCPAGIMPHLIHKFLYNDDLDEAERARVDLCVGCGLCSFVCPSKIELAAQLIDAQEKIRSEHQGKEAAK